MKIKGLKITAVIVFLIITHVQGQNNSIYTVHTNQVKASIEPTMWGCFF